MGDASHDLTTATFQELCAELASRCDATAIIARLKVPAGTEDGSNVWIARYGDRLTVRGLAADLDDLLRHESRRPVGITGGKS